MDESMRLYDIKALKIGEFDGVKQAMLVPEAVRKYHRVRAHYTLH
jgi:hypothetical protein